MSRAKTLWITLVALIAIALVLAVNVATATETVPNQKWIRMTNAAAGPYTDISGSPEAEYAEQQMRAYITKKWGHDIVTKSVTAVHSPQRPVVVAQAIDQVIVKEPKSLLAKEGNNILAIVMALNDQRRAWLVLFIDLDGDGTNVFIIEMYRETPEDQG